MFNAVMCWNLIENPNVLYLSFTRKDIRQTYVIWIWGKEYQVSISNSPT